jgi:uncharacterized UBP type Zn finger protein
MEKNNLQKTNFEECLLCGKELEKGDVDFCDTCFQVLIAKHSKTKFREVTKWHKKNAKELRE